MTTIASPLVDPGLFLAVQQAAPLTEEDGQLSGALTAQLRDAGVFRMLVPAALGGLQTPLPEAIAVIEQLSAADGSAGWLASIGVLSNALSAWMVPAFAERLFQDDPGVILGGSAIPGGRAVPVEGGYRVSGHWTFASGCRHAGWLFALCLTPEGLPVLATLPAAACEIVPNWQTLGLRGTGSHDFAVHDQFVPEEQTFMPFGQAPRQPDLLYTLGVDALFSLTVAPVPLGIAQAALDETRHLMQTKAARGGGLLSAHPVVQENYAEATGLYLAARAFVMQVAQQYCEAVQQGRPLSAAERAQASLAARHAAAASVRVVERMLDLAGTSAVRQGARLERQHRDVTTAARHVRFHWSGEVQAGQTLLEGAPALPQERSN
ncbi:hydrolase (plasmid) [Deinococcus sp. KNUC1210]|uniref:acyl-CoA dehydrogenase family protein n=1 Tax=Deinococcus sp. KNUC1210 TaxID=2917691 RepID=UPI001EF04DA5|nr:acyl-CoA dehydrogenase family protein [Deinococcus sp. KNUC1210]ULH17560.1 hydrolase [Deinococcus sp. KNUC1210]